MSIAIVVDAATPWRIVPSFSSAAPRRLMRSSKMSGWPHVHDVRSARRFLPGEFCARDRSALPARPRSTARRAAAACGRGRNRALGPRRARRTPRRFVDVGEHPLHQVDHRVVEAPGHQAQTIPARIPTYPWRELLLHSLINVLRTALCLPACCCRESAASSGTRRGTGPARRASS